jgi:hypothetical protein
MFSSLLRILVEVTANKKATHWKEKKIWLNRSCLISRNGEDSPVIRERVAEAGAARSFAAGTSRR